MKKVIFTLWIVPVGLIVFIAFGADKTRRNFNAPNFSPLIGRMKPIKSMNNSDSFGVKLGTGLIFNESEKKITIQDALVTVDAMNNIAEAFNNTYGFQNSSLSMLRALSLFLEDSKNQLILEQLLQILKDKAANFPEEFLDIAVSIEEAIDNKNAEQFLAVYSALENYFKGFLITPLVKIGQINWRAMITNIKNAVASRIRRAYYYLFPNLYRKSSYQ